jgi:hypothetical protein
MLFFNKPESKYWMEFYMLIDVNLVLKTTRDTITTKQN